MVETKGKALDIRERFPNYKLWKAKRILIKDNGKGYISSVRANEQGTSPLLLLLRSDR
jgi:hypothetical protein